MLRVSEWYWPFPSRAFTHRASDSRTPPSSSTGTVSILDQVPVTFPVSGLEVVLDSLMDVLPQGLRDSDDTADLMVTYAVTLALPPCRATSY